MIVKGSQLDQMFKLDSGAVNGGPFLKLKTIVALRRNLRKKKKQSNLSKIYSLKGKVHQLDIFDKNDKFQSSRVQAVCRPENIQHEILIETYRPWVKKLGQWHLSNDDGQTRCGVPMLGNNYANEIPEEHRTKCEKCFR